MKLFPSEFFHFKNLTVGNGRLTIFAGINVWEQDSMAPKPFDAQIMYQRVVLVCKVNVGMQALAMADARCSAATDT